MPAEVAIVSDPSERRSTSFSSLKRTAMRNLLKTWQDIKGSARAITGDIHPDLPKLDQERLCKQMRDCLEGRGGEVSARARTVALGEVYLSLSPRGKERFLRLLNDRFCISKEAISELAAAYSESQDEERRDKILSQLRETLTSDRYKLLSQFSALPDGFKFLVDMRADLLPLVQKEKELRPLEGDFKRLLSSWFDIGLLELRTIDWNAPAALLEKLIAYEAVHEIVSWDDLKNRLDSDRRCYAFFHPKMPMEPLIFVEVALVNGLADNIQRLLDVDAPSSNPDEADTAIFYSISNAQSGLAGISFGNFLIKRVVDKIRHQLPNVKHFATLSPIPGFRSWLDPKLAADEKGLFTATEQKSLARLAGGQSVAAFVLEQLQRADWPQNAALAEALKEPLLRLCARYLEQEKRGETAALDPVAHFHLTNGARLEYINWLANRSPRGLKQSAGMMVNYYYKLKHIDENHEKYASDGLVVASKHVKALL